MSIKGSEKVNQEYVKNFLTKPNNDQKMVYKPAKEMITDKTYLDQLIEYCVDNLLEAIYAYNDDYDNEKLYYTMEINGVKRDIYFGLAHIPHLLGLPQPKVLGKAAIMRKLLKQEMTSENWLRIFKHILETNKNEIVDFDSDPENIGQEKLNWDKISEKVFDFLNLGILSEENVYCYREDISLTKYDIDKYLIVKPLISDPEKGVLVIQFAVEKNGDREVWIPQSIRKIENITISEDGYVPKTITIGPRENSKRYRYMPVVIEIEQKQGGKYGQNQF